MAIPLRERSACTWSMTPWPSPRTCTWPCCDWGTRLVGEVSMFMPPGHFIGRACRGSCSFVPGSATLNRTLVKHAHEFVDWDCMWPHEPTAC
mmetsp:Transcript_72379/g.187802  ORF Transcript_72379/g.187802 Transcript_72379/m.187802 type:complete len:92 (+) Transcript_72379:80-355(+)